MSTLRRSSLTTLFPSPLESAVHGSPVARYSQSGIVDASQSSHHQHHFPVDKRNTRHVIHDMKQYSRLPLPDNPVAVVSDGTTFISR